jgi:hypothetical protein
MQRHTFRMDEGVMDVFRMLWAQLAGLAIATLHVMPKALSQQPPHSQHPWHSSLPWQLQSYQRCVIGCISD